MQRTTLKRVILPLLLAVACDDPDLAGVPDRGEDDPDLVSFRGDAGSYSGSYRLNTAKLFAEGLEVRHFDYTGDPVIYDNPEATRVTFQRVRLAAGGGEFFASSSTFIVENGTLRINGQLYQPGQLLGSEWLYTLQDNTNPARPITLRVSGVGIATTPAGPVPLYNFTLTGATTFYNDGTNSACDKLDALTNTRIVWAQPDLMPPGVPNNFKSRTSAVLYGGVRVSELGVVANDAQVATVACVSGAVGKAALWGYPSWVSPYLGRSATQQLQAVTRAIRADFCANGTSHTVDGTPIQVRDRYYDMFVDPIEATEAVWGTYGARCRVTHDRLASGGVFSCGGALLTDCNQSAADWINGPDQFMWTKVDPAMTVTPTRTPCDTAAPTPGCADPGIQATVCAASPGCCSVAWSAACVSKVTSLGAAADACCTANGAPGCGSAAVTDCVGDYDPSCTSTAWDSYCAQEVESLGCGVCR